MNALFLLPNNRKVNYMVSEMKKPRNPLSYEAIFVFEVAPLGLEPRHTVPKTAVLPIRRWGILFKRSANVKKISFLQSNFFEFVFKTFSRHHKAFRQRLVF